MLNQGVGWRHDADWNLGCSLPVSGPARRIARVTDSPLRRRRPSRATSRKTGRLREGGPMSRSRNDVPPLQRERARGRVRTGAFMCALPSRKLSITSTFKLLRSGTSCGGNVPPNTRRAAISRRSCWNRARALSTARYFTHWNRPRVMSSFGELAGFTSTAATAFRGSEENIDAVAGRKTVFNFAVCIISETNDLRILADEQLQREVRRALSTASCPSCILDNLSEIGRCWLGPKTGEDLRPIWIGEDLGPIHPR